MAPARNSHVAHCHLTGSPLIRHSTVRRFARRGESLLADASACNFSPNTIEAALTANHAASALVQSTKMPVGTVDASGVLWNSSSVGKFLYSRRGMDTIWKMISSAAAKFPTANAVGWRPVLTREWLAEPGSTAKFEKLTLGDYQFIDFATYLKRIEDVASGLVGLTGLERGDFVVIYAETQMEWMLTAMACWRMGLTVVTIYATLGAEGALHGVTQAKCKAVIADAKLLKVCDAPGPARPAPHSKPRYPPHPPTTAPPLLPSRCSPRSPTSAPTSSTW